MADLQARIVITAVDQVSKQLGGISNRMSGFAKKVGRVGAGTAAAGAAILAPVVAIGTAAVAATVDYEKAMLEWKKASDDLGTAEGFDKAYETISRLSRVLPQSHVELTQMATQASKAGVAFDELEGFVTLTAQAASAFDIEAKTAGEMLSGIKEGAGLSNKEMQLLLGQMDLLENKYKTTGAHLADYLSRTGGVARQAGISNQELIALGTTMEAAGQPAEKLARAMQRVAMNLTKGENLSKSQAKAWKSLGVDSVWAAKELQKDGGLLTVMEAMKKGLDALPDHEGLNVIGTIVDVAAAAPFMAALQNLETYRDAMALTSDEMAAMQQLQASFDIGMEGLGMQANMMKNAFADVILAMGRELMPYTKAFVGYVTELVQKLKENPKVMKWLVSGLLAIAGVGAGLMVVGGALTLMGTALSAIGAIASLGVLITLGPAILAIVAAFKHWDVVGPAWWDMVDAAKALWEAIKPVGSAIMEVVTAIGEAFDSDMSGLAKEFKPLEAIANVLKQLFTEIAGVIRSITEMLNGEFDWSKLLPSVEFKEPGWIKWLRERSTGAQADAASAEARANASTAAAAGQAASGLWNHLKNQFAVHSSAAAGSDVDKGAMDKIIAATKTPQAAATGAQSKVDLNIPKNAALLKDSVPVEGAVSIVNDVPVKVDGQIDARFTVQAEPGTTITQQGIATRGRNVSASTNSPGVSRTGHSDADIPVGP